MKNSGSAPQWSRPAIRLLAMWDEREYHCSVTKRVSPKTFELSRLSGEDVQLEWRLNLTSGKILSGLTPLEVFAGRRVVRII